MDLHPAPVMHPGGQEPAVGAAHHRPQILHRDHQTLDDVDEHLHHPDATQMQPDRHTVRHETPPSDSTGFVTTESGGVSAHHEAFPDTPISLPPHDSAKNQLAAVSDLVEAASGKLILIGDPHQLPEIDAGGLFRALVARLPTVELTENVRQHHSWERTALAELRNGSVDRAVAMYHRRHRILTAATPTDTIDQAVGKWYQDVEAIGDPAQVLLVGLRNTTVDELNRRARNRIAAAGLLHGPALTVGDREFQVGDRVVCLKNKPRPGVLNGDLATITDFDPQRRSVTLRLDRTDRPVTVPHWYLDDGHLDWGYALTGHKAQGATARRAHTVVEGAADRQWTYVTMSRGQEANTIYLTEPDMGQEECEHLAHQHPDRRAALITALVRSDAEAAAVDTGRGLPSPTDGQCVESRDLVTGGHPESSRGCPHGRTMPNRDVKQFLRRRIGRGEWRDGRGPSRALSR